MDGPHSKCRCRRTENEGGGSSSSQNHNNQSIPSLPFPSLLFPPCPPLPSPKFEYLLERLSRSKKWEDVQLSMGLNPNNSANLFGSEGMGGGAAGGSQQQQEAKSGAQITGGFQASDLIC